MKKLLSLFLVATIAFSACEKPQKKQDSASPEKKLNVFAVNYPVYYFAERIAGEYIDLLYPVPMDVDPAYWEPKELAEIQSVDLILANGANYAKWMKKVSLPSSKIINTSKEFSDDYIEVEEGASHSHGATGEHVHSDYAITTWLDFKIAIGQAEAIMKVFVEKLPEHKAVILSNYDQLKSELSDLDASMVLVGDKLKSQTLFASHPVYQYAEQAYDLTILSEHWEPGELPSDEQWQDFLTKLDQHPSTIMLWEGEPSVEIVSLLMESGVESIVFNPCGNTPAEGDFMSVMIDNVNRLKSSIK